jgi:hypothetical protein
MRGAGRLPWLATLLPLVAVGCGAAGVTPPQTDGGGQDVGLTACVGDNDCPYGQSCVTGYCQAAVGADAAVDAVADTAGPPRLSVTPTQLDFGNPLMGEEYTRGVTVTNAGGGVLTVTELNLSQAPAGSAFTLQAPSVPFTVAAGDSVPITVVLRLTDDVIPTGSLKIHSDDPSPVSADATVDLVARSKGSPLLGVCVRDPAAPADGGTSPGCRVGTDGSPLLDFGTVPYGSGAALVVELTNTGDGNLPIKVSGTQLDDGTVGFLTVRAFAAVSGVEQPATFPFYVSIGDPGATPPLDPTKLVVHVTFEAVVEGTVPPNALVVTSDLAGSPTLIPIKGQVLGCTPVVPDGGILPDGGADPQTDPNNCGTCGTVCSTVNAAPTCVAGTCVESCALGFGDCDHKAATGCETDLMTTTARCGSCDTACVNANGATSCIAGVCHPVCVAGAGDCDGNRVNGCETDLTTDGANCGACGVACVNPNGTTACVGGACTPTCAGGWSLCGGAPRLGCLVHTGVDPSNCGPCGHVCTNAGGSVSCVDGTCQPGCASGYANCDGDPSNGCEAAILTDADHCGGCTTACSSNHMATRSCVGGACTGTCVAGFADCNGDKATDGCETDTQTDPRNCGGCGQSACYATAPPVACDGNKVVTYGVPGTCAAGACTYPSTSSVCPNGGGCFNAQCTTAPTFEGNVAAYVAIAGTPVYPPNGGTSSTTLGTDFYVETSPKGSEKAVHLFYSINNNFGGVPGTDLVMQFNQWLGSNDQWKATVPAQPAGTTVYWYLRFDHYDGGAAYWSNYGNNFSYQTH